VNKARYTPGRRNTALRNATLTALRKSPIALKVIVVVELGAHFVFLSLATIASFDHCLIVVCDIRTYPPTGESCQYKLVGTSLVPRHFCSSNRCYHY